jgi:hypothetical protein
MAKLPFGGFNLADFDRVNGVKSLYGENSPGLTPWQRLDEIANALEEAERLDDGRLALYLPSELAAWLGIAIKASNHDQQDLLLRLGLKKKQGKPGKNFNDWWIALAERILEIKEKKKVSTDKAVGELIQELQEKFPDLDDGNENMPSIETLKRYVNEYIKLRDDIT